MKALFDQISTTCSKLVTRTYSTSFSLGIRLLDKRLQTPIYNIYAFVRFADEIVDSFHGYPKAALLKDFRSQTYAALEMGVSLNPVLNSFQYTVRKYGIDHVLIDTFLDSMEMDLNQQAYSRRLYEQYILGSAEVVGLMCLRVFCENDNELYERLKIAAMKLGAAFQKVNFLRDIKADSLDLGRMYFPGLQISSFDQKHKRLIEEEIEADFEQALVGIRGLPKTARKGVYLAYTYYWVLFNKIRRLEPAHVMSARVRVSDRYKFGLLLRALILPQVKLL
jgi:phytoene synthase